MSENEKVEVGKPLGHKRDRRKRMIVAAVVLLILVAAVVIYLTHRPEKPTVPRSILLQQNLNKKVPSTKEGKVIYYTDLGQGYFDQGDYGKAIDTFKLADDNITDRSANAPYSVNVALYRSYNAAGNKSAAAKYLQREIDRLKSNPDNDDTVKALQSLKDQL